MENFTVYKSSAGSGKTYTLVREYIALALYSPSYFRHILAITFTNKAANEMKLRVVKSLVQISKSGVGDDSPAIQHLIGELVEKTGFGAEEIARRAADVLSTLLHEYDDFAVRTIDSFVARIIRTFAHDLHLPVDFEIEMDKDVLLDEAITNLISKAGIDPQLTSILVEFAESKAEEEKSWHIEQDLSKMGSNLFSEDGYQYASQLLEITPARIMALISRIRAFIAKFTESVSNPSREAMALIKSNGIYIESFYYGKQGIGSFFSDLASGRIHLPNTRVLTTIEESCWYGNKTDPAQKSAIESIRQQLLDLYKQCNEILEKDFKGFRLLEMVLKQIYQLGVLGAIEQELAAVKKEKRVLHVSEFNRFITNIINTEPVPFIYERTGEKYRNYLIDEFQDTSELQWKNLLPLIADSLARGNFNLVVGDGKQAIYRFRNGQVEQFVMLPALPEKYDPNVFGDAALALRQNYLEKVLDSNFRSLPGIIGFNNDFFRFVSDKLPPHLVPIYAQVEQKPASGKQGGFVKIDFIPSDSNEDFQANTLAKIKQLVLELLEQGYSLNDIVILTRSNIQGSTVARFLMKEDFRVISAEALLLASSAEVNFLVSLLTYILDTSDEIAAVSFMIYLLQRRKVGCNVQDLSILVKSGKLHDYLTEQGIPFNPFYLRKLPLYDLCEEVIRIFGLNGGPYNPYIQFFLEFVAGQAKSNALHLDDLLEVWEEKKTKLSVVVPEGIDAIRIMTIHKSKGLEFPVVIWPFATESLKNTKDFIWARPEHPVLRDLPLALFRTSSELSEVGFGELYEEERSKSILDMVNLVYVAFTRPIEKLFVLSKEPPKSRTGQLNLAGLLAEYFESTTLQWHRESDTYQYGATGTQNRVPASSREEEPAAGMLISEPWNHRIMISRRAPHTWGVSNRRTDSQAWGTLVHEALSKLKGQAEVGELLKHIERTYMLTEEEVEKLEKDVTSLISHTQLESYFKENVVLMSEREILTPDGRMLRPDRVVVTGNEAVILEYKTGVAKREHQDQVNEYAKALSEMGFVSVKKLLVYIDEPIEIREVP